MKTTLRSLSRVFLQSAFFLLPFVALAATNELTSLLQQGLFEEEANRNLNAAISNYQALATKYDQDRQVAAAAVFRLGDCYRKLGRTNEAVVQFQRILREFSDQKALTTSSRQKLTELGAEAEPAEASPLASQARQEQKALLEKQIKLAEQDQADVQKQFEMGKATSAEVRAAERDVLRLRQQLAALDSHRPELLDLSPPAASEEDREIRRIEVLLQGSPDLINAPGKDGETLLQAAASKGQLGVVQYLLDHGATPDVPQGAGLTALHYAAGNGHKAVVDLLIRRGANPGAETPTGVTPLHLAARKGYTQVAKALIDAGAPLNTPVKQNVNRRDQDPEYSFRVGDRPLTLAVANGLAGIAELLVAAKADLEAADGDGVPPLIKAVWAGQKGMAQLLLEHGAKVDVRDNGKASALHRAAASGARELMELLLSHGADVNARDGAGSTPLHWAAANARKDAVEFLLAHGAEVNARNNSGETALYQAAQRKSSECVAALLAAKADPNLASAEPNYKDWAPLHWASLNRDLTSAELLLQHGADPNARMATSYPAGYTLPVPSRDTQGFQAADGTPLLMAAANDQTDLVQLLLRYKANPNLAGRTGWVPLQLEILKTNAAAVADLLDHGADITVTDPNGNTPLHQAVMGQSRSLVELLLSHQADPNVRNQFGQTPLYLAKYNAGNSPVKSPALPGVRRLAPARGEVRPEAPGSTGANADSEAQSIVDLLRAHGALDKLPDWGSIEVCRPASGFSVAVFPKGTNDWNRFTLLETLLNFYGSGRPYSAIMGDNTYYTAQSGTSWLPFPDLSRLVVVRPIRGSTNFTRITVNVLNATNGIDCAKDITLEFGDKVEIPERDHPLGEAIVGLTSGQAETLRKCFSITVQLKVRDSSVELHPDIYDSRIGLALALPAAQNLLLASSDLSRVKLIRRDPSTRKTREWVLDCRPQPPKGPRPMPIPQMMPPGYGTNPTYTGPDLRLRNGDLIEVPEK